MKRVMLIIKHERLWTWEVMKMNLARLQKVHSFEIVVTGDIENCDEFHQVNTPNKPLGNKLQKGLEKVKELKPDYVIFSGMDHLISDSLFEKYLELMKEGNEYIGFTDLYFFDRQTNKLFYSWGYTNNRQGETQGTWRTLSKEALDKCNWELWDNEAIGQLDKTFTNNSKSLKLTSFTLREHGLVAIDIKEENTLNTLDDIETKHEVKQEILKNLSEQEYSYLMEETDI